MSLRCVYILQTIDCNCMYLQFDVLVYMALVHTTSGKHKRFYTAVINLYVLDNTKPGYFQPLQFHENEG